MEYGAGGGCRCDDGHDRVLIIGEHTDASWRVMMIDDDVVPIEANARELL